jgi:hypothetical protein
VGERALNGREGTWNVHVSGRKHAGYGHRCVVARSSAGLTRFWSCRSAAYRHRELWQ